jgi:hypothetical protein
LCTLHQREDRGERRLAAHAQGFDEQGRGRVDASRDHLVAALDGARPGLAREQGLFHAAATLDHPTVGGQGLARPHDEAIAPHQCLCGHQALDARFDAPSQRRYGEGQAPREGGGAVPCAHLEIAAQTQEEGKHAGRVEIDLALAAEGRPGAHEKGACDRECHRYVHPGPADAQVPHGPDEEGPRTDQDDRCRDDQAQPTEEAPVAVLHALEGSGVERDGIGHHVHRAEAGHAESDQRRAVLVSLDLGCLVCAVGSSCEADLCEATDHLPQRHARRQPLEPNAMRGQVHASGADAGKSFQVPLDQPDAGGAGDALDEKRRFPGLVLLGLRDRAGLEGLVVQPCNAFEYVRDELWLDAGRSLAMHVPIREPLGLEHLGDRAAAHTAHRPCVPPHAGEEIESRRNRQPAVKARGSLGGRLGGHAQCWARALPGGTPRVAGGAELVRSTSTSP